MTIPSLIFSKPAYHLLFSNIFWPHQGLLTTMDKPIIAVIQHKLLVTKTLDELTEYYHRFLRIAKTKGSHLAVFPELSGLAVGIPMFPGWRNALLKEAATPKKGLIPKLKGMLAGSAANVVRADLKKSLLMTLSEIPESLYQVYVDLFSNLAHEYDMTIVAGSIYLYDEKHAGYRHAALVFGPDGAILGRQDQVVRDPETLEIVQPGSGWTPIQTPVGNIGLLFGYETLYPEPARILAYQSADMLIALAATKRPATYSKIYHAMQARGEENQLYAAVSFLVGEDPFAGTEEPLFLGKSAIYAPLEFTPRFSGIMTQMGSAQAEGVITAEWDYPALRSLWQESETPLRRQMPLETLGLLAQIYDQSLTLDQATTRPALAAPPEETVEDTHLLPSPETSEIPPSPPETSSDIESPSPPSEEEELPIFTPILPTEAPVIELLEETEESDRDEDGDEPEQLTEDHVTSSATIEASDNTQTAPPSAEDNGRSSHEPSAETDKKSQGQ